MKARDPRSVPAPVRSRGGHWPHIWLATILSGP
jgi:hypothetical protein